MPKTKERNCSIDCLRFVYAWIIVCFHYYTVYTNGDVKHFVGGNGSVEFFLITAAVFFFMSFDREEQKVHRGGVIRSPGAHFIRRFWRMFPWVVTSVVCCMAVEVRFNRPISSLADLVRFVADSLPDIFMVRHAGISTSGATMNVFTWTIHSMLLVELVMWGCLKFFKRIFTEYIVPVSFFGGLVLWAHYGKAWLGFMQFNTLRTWIAYCAGYECLLLTKKLTDISFTRRGEMILTALECGLHGIIMLGMFLNMTNLQYRWLITYIGFGSLIAFSLSGHSHLNRWLNGSKALKKLSGALGELSLPVYLMQGFVFEVLKRVYPDIQARYESKPVFVAALMGCAVLQWLIVPWLVKGARAGRARIRKVLISGA